MFRWCGGLNSMVTFAPESHAKLLWSQLNPPTLCHSQQLWIKKKIYHLSYTPDPFVQPCKQIRCKYTQKHKCHKCSECFIEKCQNITEIRDLLCYGFFLKISIRFIVEQSKCSFVVLPEENLKSAWNTRLNSWTISYNLNHLKSDLKRIKPERDRRWSGTFNAWALLHADSSNTIFKPRTISKLI